MTATPNTKSTDPKINQPGMLWEYLLSMQAFTKDRMNKLCAVGGWVGLLSVVWSVGMAGSVCYLYFSDACVQRMLSLLVRNPDGARKKAQRIISPFSLR